MKKRDFNDFNKLAYDSNQLKKIVKINVNITDITDEVK